MERKRYESVITIYLGFLSPFDCTDHYYALDYSLLMAIKQTIADWTLSDTLNVHTKLVALQSTHSAQFPTSTQGAPVSPVRTSSFTNFIECQITLLPQQQLNWNELNTVNNDMRNLRNQNQIFHGQFDGYY